MELIEGSETSAIRTQTPGNYPKENILRQRLFYYLENCRISWRTIANFHIKKENIVLFLQAIG